MGIHVSEVTTDELDIYGVGVNLADRLSSLAKPGDIVLSVEARDELVPSLDPDVDDMGESWLKHIDEPVRTFRIVQGATSAKNTVPSGRDEIHERLLQEPEHESELRDLRRVRGSDKGLCRQVGNMRSVHTRNEGLGERRQGADRGPMRR